MRGVLVFTLIGSLWSTYVCPARADGRIMSAALYSGLAAADLASTEYALSNGARELNPLMRNRGARYALKVAQVGVLTWLDHEAGKKDKGLQRIVRAIAIAVAAFAVQHNMRQGR